MHQGPRPQLAAPLRAVLLLLAAHAAGAQHGAIPPGSLSGPTPFVGAYYFNWYDLENQWERYQTTRNPTLGRYDQSDPSVLVQHHKWGKQGGIDFFAMAWSGGGSDLIQWERAEEIDRRIDAHLKMTDGVKVALMYNIRDFAQAGANGKVDMAEENYCAILSDHFAYAARTHMQADNYFRVGDNPVLFLYTLRDYVNYVDCIKMALERMLIESGVVPYIIGDTVWWSPAADKFDWADFRAINVSAVTGFNTYDAGQPRRMGHNFAWDNAQLYHDMIQPAWAQNMVVIPSISPGFDDRKLRGHDRPVIDRASGAEMVQQWKLVLWYPMCQTKLINTIRRMPGMLMKSFALNSAGHNMAKGKHARGAKGKRKQIMNVAAGWATVSPPIIMVNSFNEWHDGSELEPSIEEGDKMLNLLAQLKSEVVNEDMSCGKEKDKNFRAPKFVVPKMFADKSVSPADSMFIRGMSVLVWFLLMALIWICGGHLILLHTGRAPNKYKDDDLGGRHMGGAHGGMLGGVADFGASMVPTDTFIHASGKKYPKRVPTVVTFVVLLVTGCLCFGLIHVFLAIPGVSGWFDSRAVEWERRGHSNVRRAREIAHLLCPDLVCDLHPGLVLVSTCMQPREHTHKYPPPRTHTHTHTHRFSTCTNPSSRSGCESSPPTRCRSSSSGKRCVATSRCTLARSRACSWSFSGGRQSPKALRITKKRSKRGA